MTTKYRKVIRDLTSDYSKNFMLMIAISIGTFGVGSILGAYSVVKRSMTENYMGSIPASATLEVEDTLSQDLIDGVKQMAGIQEAERHATRFARMKVGDKWYPLLLFIIDDFETKKTNKIFPISGNTKPGTGSMLVERTAFVVMNAKEGDEISVKLADGVPQQIKLTGTVHDPGLAPAWQEQSGYGYISMSTLRLLGETKRFDQLRILVSDEQTSDLHITDKAKEVARWLEQKGHSVHDIQIPPPGKHPHQGQMTSIMTLFVCFSFFVLFLGSILVATAVATLMTKHIRQIGVMKAIGATSVQVIGLYLMLIAILCAGGLIIAIPLSRIAATGFSRQLAVLLNLEINDPSIPFWVIGVQAGSGMIIPLLAACIPIVRGSRISVRKALDHYGAVQKNRQGSSWIRRLSANGFFGEIFQLSIRNVFRHPSRLILSTTLLAVGGAMFMSAMNVSDAWDKCLKRVYEQRRYDLEVRLTEPVEIENILKKIRTIPGVQRAEGWGYSSAAFHQDDSVDITHTYPDRGHGSFVMQALPVGSKLLNPTLTEGRWLVNTDSAEVVLNQLALGRSSTIQIGDRITLAADGIPSTWKVVGLTEDVGSGAAAYVSLNIYSKFQHLHGKVKMLRIAYEDRSKENAVEKNKMIEALLGRENISISAFIPVWLLRNAVAAHMKVLVNSLLAMALLMALVGAIGLTSTMSINVLERTREIGVMRSIGATPGKIRNVIVWEGLCIGGLSIPVSFSLLLSAYLGDLVGNMAFRTPLSLTISEKALALWIVFVIVGSYTATLLPARRATKATAREALAYE